MGVVRWVPPQFWTGDLANFAIPSFSASRRPASSEAVWGLLVTLAARFRRTEPYGAYQSLATGHAGALAAAAFLETENHSVASCVAWIALKAILDGNQATTKQEVP